MTTPDIRAHIKLPPRIFVLISTYYLYSLFIYIFILYKKHINILTYIVGNATQKHHTFNLEQGKS